MTIDLTQITDAPHAFERSLELAPEGLDSAQVVGSVEVQVDGAVRRRGVGFVVDGTVKASGPLACSRCLEPFEWRMGESFAVEYRLASAAPQDIELALDEDELEVEFLDNETLDVGELAAAQVLLALPMRAVCEQSCAGLCPRCGANRNVRDACRCEPETDPRWAALEGLKTGGTP